jgi:hypothetical protein
MVAARAPLLAHHVLVLSRDRGRAIGFKGAMCLQSHQVDASTQSASITLDTLSTETGTAAYRMSGAAPYLSVTIACQSGV